MKFEIKSRCRAKILFSLETESLKLCVEAAVKSRADLRFADLQLADLQGADLQGADLQGADLRGANLQLANLRGADLRGANLRGADLRGAYLRAADLQGADLQGADLRGANLQLANLRGANLRGAYLRAADLQGADLQGADLRGAYLRAADLQGADLRGAYLRAAKTDFKIETNPKIIKKRLVEIARNALPDHFNNSNWHTCATTHCIAGWACVLWGKELEEKYGTANAGLVLLGAEAATHFYESTEDAAEFLKQYL